MELKEILTSIGTTAIIVTHDQDEAMSPGGMCDRDGSWPHHAAGGAEFHLRPPGQPVCRRVRFGRSNWFRGHLGRDLGQGQREFASEDGLTLHVAPGRSVDDCVQLCVRPERVTMDANDGAAPGSNRFQGHIVDASLLGAFVHYVVEIAAGRRLMLIETHRGDAPEPKGKRVIIGFAADACIVVPDEPTRATDRGLA